MGGKEWVGVSLVSQFGNCIIITLKKQSCPSMELKVSYVAAAPYLTSSLQQPGDQSHLVGFVAQQGFVCFLSTAIQGTLVVASLWRRLAENMYEYGLFRKCVYNLPASWFLWPPLPGKAAVYLWLIAVEWHEVRCWRGNGLDLEIRE